MYFYEHVNLGLAKKIPVSKAMAVASLSPVVLQIPGRRVPELSMRITLPVSGRSTAKLPVVLLSHGHGYSNYLSSLEGYAPVADFYAGHGFAVIQPTHLSSHSLGIPMDAANGAEIFVSSRPRDMSRIIDRLGEIEAAEGVSALLQGRTLDRSRIAIAGHSLGGVTAQMLLGAVNTDPRPADDPNVQADERVMELADERIRAGVIFGSPGCGFTPEGQDCLTAAGRKLMPYYGMNFAAMKTPALIVWGDSDGSNPLFDVGPEWHAHPYMYAPSPKASFCVKGGRHGFGGISGWDTEETKDESPERLAAVLRVTVAYLQAQLNGDEAIWQQVTEAVAGLESIGKIESK